MEKPRPPHAHARPGRASRSTRQPVLHESTAASGIAELDERTRLQLRSSYRFGSLVSIAAECAWKRTA